MVVGVDLGVREAADGILGPDFLIVCSTPTSRTDDYHQGEKVLTDIDLPLVEG